MEWMGDMGVAVEQLPGCTQNTPKVRFWIVLHCFATAGIPPLGGLLPTRVDSVSDTNPFIYLNH